MAPAVVPGLPVMHVLAGVLRDADGRLLLAERPPGKQLAGQWEFPGGKREPGETPRDALARELKEELGVTLDDAAPFMSVPWHAGARPMILEAWRVTLWHGAARALEGQVLHWLAPARVDVTRLTLADRPILAAVRALA